MDHKLLRIVILASFFTCWVNSFSQDPTFSQFYTASLYLNPSAIALEETTTLSVHSRSEWKEQGINFQTNQLSLVVPIPRKELVDGFLGGVGISAYQDRSINNALRTTGVNASVSTNVKLSLKSQLTLGVQGGIIQKSIDLSSFSWTSQYDPFVGFNASLPTGLEGVSESTLVPNVGAGVLYYYNYNSDFNDTKFDGFIGLSAYNLNRPNEALGESINSRLPILYKFHAGADIQVKDHVSLSPNVLVASQAANFQVNAGMYMSYIFSPLLDTWAPAFVMFGSWYRFQDAFIFSIGLGGTYYTIGFSYDVNTTSLRDFSNRVNAYEISLKLKKPGKKMVTHHTPRM